VIDTPSVPKPREGTWLWLYKIFAGLFIVILLGVHLIVNHMIVPGGLLSYNDVVRYYTNPIVPVMEIAFLIFVVSHALVGLRSILMDLNPSDKILRGIDILFILVGIGFTIYGSWLIFVIVQRGQAV